MITTNPRAIPGSIIDQLSNLVGWLKVLHWEALDGLSYELRGAVNSAAKKGEPAAPLLSAYRGLVLEEIDSRRKISPVLQWAAEAAEALEEARAISAGESDEAQLEGEFLPLLDEAAELGLIGCGSGREGGRKL